MLTTVRRLFGDSLLRNSAQIMATTVATSGVGYVFWLLAARACPPGEVGLAAAVISAITVVSMIANLGVGHTFIERLPGQHDVQAWSRVVSVGLAAASAVTVLIAVLAAAILPEVTGNLAILRRPGPAVLIVAGALATTVMTLLDYVYVAQRASGGMLGRNVAFAVGKLAVLALLAGLGLRDAAAILAAWVLTSVTVAGVTIRWLLPRLRPGMRLGLVGGGRELGALSRSLTGHHLTNLGQMLPTFLLPVLVLVRRGPEASAVFYLTWMLGSILFMASPAVASALFAEGSHDPAAVRRTVRRCALIIGAVLVGPMVVFLTAGGWLLSVFGPQYRQGGQALLILLVVAAIPDAITNVTVAVWRVRGRLRACVVLNLVMAVVTVGGAWLTLPTFGATGAGVAWLAAQTVGAIGVLVVTGYGRRRRGAVMAGRRAAQPPVSMRR